jgi:phosphate starvation-inducible PhoH-like protein
MKKSTRKLSLEPSSDLAQLIKENEKLIPKLEDKFNVKITINKIGFCVIKGTKEDSKYILDELEKLRDLKRKPNENDLNNILEGKEISEEEIDAIKYIKDFKFRDKRGNEIRIKPKTENQKKLIDLMIEKKVTFAGGASGSGKTFLAIAMALKYLEEKKISKIIITRPSVTSEDFGYIPGGINEKMTPFLYPILDMLSQLIGAEKRDDYMEKGIIQILPVAYSRGITIGSSFKPTIGIVDESENLTVKQMFLMLSRIGDHENSKLIFCGDVYQSDLKNKDANSLTIVEQILKDSPYVGFISFTKDDVVRSAAVKDIVERFEKYECEKNKKEK